MQQDSITLYGSYQLLAICFPLPFISLALYYLGNIILTGFALVFAGMIQNAWYRSKRNSPPPALFRMVSKLAFCHVESCHICVSQTCMHLFYYFIVVVAAAAVAILVAAAV